MSCDIKCSRWLKKNPCKASLVNKKKYVQIMNCLQINYLVSNINTIKGPSMEKDVFRVHNVIQ